MRLLEQHDYEMYLEASAEIDFLDPEIQSFIDGTGWRELADIQKAKNVFHYVRDEIRHSIDARDFMVTCSASSVFRSQTGLCYAKSHLAAALLRGLGVPTGLCYQKLVDSSKTGRGYVLHGLNAFWADGRWIRFDARGNRSGINAQFSCDEELLAFQTRHELGEYDFPSVWAVPNRAVIEALRADETAEFIFSTNLPSELL